MCTFRVPISYNGVEDNGDLACMSQMKLNMSDMLEDATIAVFIQVDIRPGPDQA